MSELTILSNEELDTINGGISAWVIIGISALVIFSLGFLDGIVNPEKCRP